MPNNQRDTCSDAFVGQAPPARPRTSGWLKGVQWLVPAAMPSWAKRRAVRLGSDLRRSSSRSCSPTSLCDTRVSQGLAVTNERGTETRGDGSCSSVSAAWTRESQCMTKPGWVCSGMMPTPGGLVQRQDDCWLVKRRADCGLEKGGDVTVRCASRRWRRFSNATAIPSNGVPVVPRRDLI